VALQPLDRDEAFDEITGGAEVVGDSIGAATRDSHVRPLPLGAQSPGDRAAVRS
jgi:hypothetical protein